MESMMAVMVVTVALTLFIAILPSMISENETREEIPKDILNNLSVSDGKINSNNLERVIEDRGYTAMSLKIVVTGTSDVYEAKNGTPNGDDIIHQSGTMVMNVDGCMRNVEYEMAVWK